MITGVIHFQDGTLVVEFPYGSYDLSDHLGSIGIRTPAAELPARGTERIEIGLTSSELIGKLVLSKLQDSDTLSEVNLACQEIERVCPYGYDEFLDMLEPKAEPKTDRYRFYRQYETLPPSTAAGMKYILEETRRYRTTMENYALVCKAAEDKEYGQPDDENEDWER